MTVVTQYHIACAAGRRIDSKLCDRISVAATFIVACGKTPGITIFRHRATGQEQYDKRTDCGQPPYVQRYIHTVDNGELRSANSLRTNLNKIDRHLNRKYA